MTTAETAEGNISEQLHNLLKVWTHCDLILDRELSDPLAAEVAALVEQGTGLPINPKQAALPLDRCLMAARLSLCQLEILERSIEISLVQNTDPICRVRAIGGWLFSRDVALDRMVHRLAQAIIVRVQDAPAALLRIWDPRVLGHLARILTPDQLFDLLGPVECWAWVNRDGELQFLRRPALSGPVRPLALPVLLSPEQDAAIDRIENFNALLKTLSKLGHRIAPERDQELDALLLIAQDKGHRNVPDMLAYCLHALLISKTFDTIPEVRQAILHAHSRGLGLCAALEQFNDAYWDAHKLSANACGPDIAHFNSKKP